MKFDFWIQININKKKRNCRVEVTSGYLDVVETRVVYGHNKKASQIAEGIMRHHIKKAEEVTK